MKSNRIYTQTILGIIAVSLFSLLNMGCVFGQIGRTIGGTPERDSGMKDKSAATPKKTQEKTIIGRWKSSEALVEIRPNGKLTINGNLYDYEVSGSTLIVSNDEGSMDFPFRLNGDTLTVTFEGRKIVYQRMSAGSNGDKEEAEMPRNNRGAGSNNPQELVGKWCYLASFTANNGGGRQSETCFVLNPNGTYTYHSETSNSNPYGGSNSQTDDSGRWSATATTLTAHSNSGETKTYSLEKRNHPKTGDPMLMVDGDAFVTFYQKRPW